MTPEEKLEKVEELLAARDEITQELLELMGAESEEDDEEEQPQPLRKQRTCSACGRPGHTAKTCNKKQPDVVPPTETRKRAKGAPCEECGSTGTRHFKTCSQSRTSSAGGGITRSNGATILDAPKRLTEEEYNEVCEQFGDGLTTEMISYSYPHIELSEINKATISETYQLYITTI